MPYNRYLNKVIRTAHLQDDSVTNAKTAHRLPKFLTFLYDFAALGGSAGSLTMTAEDGTAQTIPGNAIITNAYAEVETALEMDRIAQIALNESIKILEATEKIYSITLKEYGQGIVGFEEIITQENRLSDVKIYLAQSEKMRIEKRINLILALGGGFRFETKR